MPGLLQRLFRGIHRGRHRPDWTDFAGPDLAERIMDVVVTDRVHSKQGRSTGRWVLHGGDRRLVVYLKRHYRLPWWRRVLATLWPGFGWSPAYAELRNLEWAKERGIPAPQPVAVGEWIGPAFRLRSFLAIEELTGMLPLHEAIPLALAELSAVAFRRWKNAVIAEIARLARMLHHAGRYHKDFYLCHFYVHTDNLSEDESLRGRVALIDLHRMCRHRWTGGYWRVKDLAQLWYSTDGVAGISITDCLRFWRHYRGLGSAGSKRLLRAVQWKTARYRRHNAKRERLPSPGSTVPGRGQPMVRP